MQPRIINRIKPLHFSKGSTLSAFLNPLYCFHYLISYYHICALFYVFTLFTKTCICESSMSRFQNFLLSSLSPIWLFLSLNFMLESWAHNPQVFSYSALVRSCYSGKPLKRVLLFDHLRFNKPLIGLIGYKEFRILIMISYKLI